MNISTDILDFIKLYGKASVPGFGVFSIQKSGAMLDKKTNTLLPPSQQIIFEKNQVENDEGLIQFLAKREKISPEKIEKHFFEQIENWSNLLQAQQDFAIEGIGKFNFTQAEVSFQGNRIENENADFFGLEEIKIADIQKPSSYKAPKNTRKQEGNFFNKILLWTFLVFIPVLGIVYLAISQQDLLFGKKSFGEVSIKNSTHRIEETPKIDSLKSKISQDSLQKDSTQTTTKPQLKTISHGK
jgi:hypothetical protein